MKKWNVILPPKANKQLKKLPKVIQDITFEALENLEVEGATPKYWNVKKINNNEYRLRINYRYRMCYKVEEEKLIIEVFYIGHRKDAYK